MMTIHDKLFNYQTQDRDALLARKTAILAEQIGAGKTIIAMAVMDRLWQSGLVNKVLVVAPNSAIPQWCDELRDWLDIEPYPVYGGRGKEDRFHKYEWFKNSVQYPVLLINYSSLRTDVQQLRYLGLKCCFLDEATAIKGFDSATAMSAKQLTLTCEYRCLMTGCTTSRVRVLTSRGLVLASEVKVGDVLLSKGKICYVQAVKENPPEPIYRLETESGYWLEGNAEHPVFTRRGFVFIRDLQMWDEILLDTGFKSVSVVNSPCFSVISLRKGVSGRQASNFAKRDFTLDEFVKLIAWLVGDGWLSKQGDYVGFVFGNLDKQQCEEIKNILSNVGFSFSCRDRGSWSEVLVGSQQLWKFFSSLGVESGGAKFKCVPDLIFSLSFKEQSLFLKYLWATDGNYKVENGVLREIRFASSSRELMDGVQLLLSSLGIVSHIRKFVRRGSEEFSLRVDTACINDFLKEVGFLPGKCSSVVVNVDVKVDVRWVRVISIKQTGFEKTYGIELEGGVYVTNGIVSHNTPIQNNLLELHALMSAVEPNILGQYWWFRNRFVEDKEILVPCWGPNGRGLRPVRKIVGYKNLDELQPAIQMYCIRNGAAEVSEKLPEVVVENRFVDLTPPQRVKYNEIASGILQMGEEYKRVNMLERLVRLFECSDSLKLLGDTEDRSSKIDEVINLLTGELEGTKTVVFCQYKIPLKSIVERLKKLDIPVGVIDGDVPVEQRAKAQKEFNEGSVNVLLITTAGEMALNLQGGSCIILLDRLYNPARNAQIIGRIARVGQSKKSVVVVNIIARNTVDETVFKILRQKTTLINDIFLEKDLNSLGIEQIKCLVRGEAEHLI